MSRVVQAGMIIGVALVAGTACNDDLTSAPELAVLTSVVPAAGATDVDPNTTVTLEFSHNMQAGMEAFFALHEGDVTGAQVAGTWSWSQDHQRMTFGPDAPLRSQMQYTVHIGGGMTDENGNTLDFDHAAQHMGGEWVTEQMMNGGMMNGGNNSMMGAGWQHANGTYGMTFSFTTS